MLTQLDSLHCPLSPALVSVARCVFMNVGHMLPAKRETAIQECHPSKMCAILSRTASLNYMYCICMCACSPGPETPHIMVLVTVPGVCLSLSWWEVNLTLCTKLPGSMYSYTSTLYCWLEQNMFTRHSSYCVKQANDGSFQLTSVQIPCTHTHTHTHT